MIRIYHNPRCSTSRKALETLQATGRPVEVVEYLHHLPPRDALRELIRAAGLTVREALRAKEPAYESLGLADPALTDEQLLDAIERHPVLLNRPFVVTDKGTRLCRPFDTIQEIL
ncbi:arsenate reductase (glutaredoxin) [Castellaniella defragrans]|uniref:Arsenate reductase n=2 Tax=Castellaniella defragrans TaxID=75697 RepID=W8X9A3_CASD6|nr:arsenate reductase (glutaredoxin) [Castellaniella defragrans]KAB0606488.1 arsenate reductase (glutaredoxin) [Castellaniella defragrans]MBB6085468.1 arsenate reductase [Castellaniella defragrans]CDM24475.1 Arsenate reductase [Castellaniella defragrans 65Phen]